MDRTETQGLVRRVPDTLDRRQVFELLTPAGENVLHRLAAIHRRELQNRHDAPQPPV